jgi:hypothetical protein
MKELEHAAESFVSEVVGLNEEFSLFAPERTDQQYWQHLGMNQSFSSITLQINGEQIPLHVRTGIPLGMIDNTLLTPFTPETSYRVDERDYTLEGRMQKRDEAGKMSNLDNPFNIEIETGMVSDLVQQRILHNTKRGYKFRKDLAEVFNRLHLLVKFPEEEYAPVYEADCVIDDSGMGFTLFRPAEMPLLPVSDRLLHRDNSVGQSGLLLMVNGDLRRLQQVRGEFILTPQKNEGIPSDDDVAA